VKILTVNLKLLKKPTAVALEDWGNIW